MISVRKTFIVDTKGNPVSVVINKKDYDKLLEYIDELEDVAAYDRAKKVKGVPVPWNKIKR